MEELQRLESAKWHPSSLGDSSKLSELFADDFVSVEYGADLHGGVERKTDMKAAMSTPEFAQFLQFLDQTQIELSEWTFLQAGDGGVIVSYRVNAPAFGWTAYAMSVWAKRDGRWQTIFYQASKAK